jgi:hypothetical protein
MNADIELRDGKLIEERRMNEDQRAEAMEAPSRRSSPRHCAR